jgi:hypothetical protein
VCVYIYIYTEEEKSLEFYLGASLLSSELPRTSLLLLISHLNNNKNGVKKGSARPQLNALQRVLTAQVH